jgi:general secretion pathway protein K
LIRPAKDSGLILVNALIMVAALASIAVYLLQSSERALTRQNLAQTAAQTHQYLDSYEVLMRSFLTTDRRASSFDSLSERWAVTEYQVPIDRGRATGSLTDLNGRFNLNLLVDGADIELAQSFLRLAKEVGVAETQARKIITFLQTKPNPAAPSYTVGALPVSVHGGPLKSILQLNLMPNFDVKTYERLAPFVTVLPSESLLNVNTAPREVLQAIMPNSAPEALAILIRDRKRAPFETIESFLLRAEQVLGTDGFEGTNVALFSVSSRWFQLTVTAALEGAEKTRVSQLYRDPKTAKTYVALRHATRP